MTSLVLAALSADVGGTFSVVYDAPITSQTVKYTEITGKNPVGGQMSYHTENSYYFDAYLDDGDNNFVFWDANLDHPNAPGVEIFPGQTICLYAEITLKANAGYCLKDFKITAECDCDFSFEYCLDLENVLEPEEFLKSVQWQSADYVYLFEEYGWGASAFSGKCSLYIKMNFDENQREISPTVNLELRCVKYKA